ncbi:MAG: LPXTG cell wall anchor domain-containing protein [Alphaproteobacteria bacterium]|nr:LPXTG cell wall anchor domain-containing protein [Alphaproteobacteria bacterium]
MAQKIGIWGCFILGLVVLVGTYLKTGFEDPVQYAGGASLLLLGGAFWLFKKNAEALAEAEETQGKEG